MEYLIILPTEELTSKERANLITRELYNVTAPVAKQFDYQVNGKVFQVLAHPDNPQLSSSWILRPGKSSARPSPPRGNTPFRWTRTSLSTARPR